MKKKLSIVAYLICMTLFVAWIWCSNGIIGKAINKDLVRKVDFESVKGQYQKDYVHYVAVSGADYIRYDGGWLDKLSISGWAFCETEGDTKNRTISILLKSEDDCYELLQYITSRPDVPINVPKDLNRPDMKITTRSGYIGQFSLIDIESGIYDIYLCCWENETNHGMANTLYQLVKNGYKTEIIPWSTSALESHKEANQPAQSRGYLDSARLKDGKITVRGWEFVDDRDCADQIVYVEIIDSQGNSVQYPTKSLTRTDVAKGYNDDRYAQSGYVTVFPEEDLHNGLSTMYVYTENGGNVWRSKSFSIYRNEDQLYVFQSRINLASAMQEHIAATVTAQSLGYLDSVKISNGLATFSGWEFAPDQESGNSSIVIELTEANGEKRQYQATAQLQRNDVAEAYHDQRYAQSGYTLTIASSDFPDGMYTVRVLVENNGEVWQSKQYTVTCNGDETTVQQY